MFCISTCFETLSIEMLCYFKKNIPDASDIQGRKMSYTFYYESVIKYSWKEYFWKYFSDLYSFVITVRYRPKENRTTVYDDVIYNWLTHESQCIAKKNVRWIRLTSRYLKKSFKNPRTREFLIPCQPSLPTFLFSSVF